MIPVRGFPLLIDATWFGHNWCLLAYINGDDNTLIYWRVAQSEYYEEIHTDLTALKQSGIIPHSITTDGRRGLILAAKQAFPEAIHQRCIVHVQRLGLALLTRKPKTLAGWYLRLLIRHIADVHAPEERDLWIAAFRQWVLSWDNFLNEKTTVSAPKPGQRKWWYTHRKLRKVRSLIVRALPDLFHFIDNPVVIATTNRLEGGLFNSLKEQTSIHRGLSQPKQQSFVSWWCHYRQKSTKAPTRNVY